MFSLQRELFEALKVTVAFTRFFSQWRTAISAFWNENNVINRLPDYAVEADRPVETCMSDC
jgi:hypothetical protein